MFFAWQWENTPILSTPYLLPFWITNPTRSGVQELDLPYKQTTLTRVLSKLQTATLSFMLVKAEESHFLQYI